MKIRGSKTEYLDFEITEHELWDKFLEMLLADGKLRSSHGYTVLPNADGNIETWEDGHGSGFTTKVPPATAWQLKIYAAYKALQDIRRNKDR